MRIGSMLTMLSSLARTDGVLVSARHRLRHGF
jgi:hypothetical protein